MVAVGTASRVASSRKAMGAAAFLTGADDTSVGITMPPGREFCNCAASGEAGEYSSNLISFGRHRKTPTATAAAAANAMAPHIHAGTMRFFASNPAATALQTPGETGSSAL